ncbi:MAG: hypothetical protein V2J65_28765 [Desulfobacteraceae bacterium]|nr:hypothetical protein [Desulfobacteraceae bacterium]
MASAFSALLRRFPRSTILLFQVFKALRFPRSIFPNLQISIVQRGYSIPHYIKAYSLCRLYSGGSVSPFRSLPTALDTPQTPGKAIPRFLFGLPAAGLFSAPLFLFPFIFALAANAFMEWIGGAQAGWTPLNFLPFGPALKYILVVFVLGWFWLFCVFFVHPTFSKKAKQALKNALRGSTTFFKH